MATRFPPPWTVEEMDATLSCSITTYKSSLLSVPNRTLYRAIKSIYQSSQTDGVPFAIMATQIALTNTVMIT
jgi:hypothetical protein